MSNRSRYEQETIINYNNEESTASVYTCNNSLQNKLAGFAESNPDCKLLRKTEDAVEYIIPKKWVKIHLPRKLSEDTLNKLSEHGKRLAAELHNTQV